MTRESAEDKKAQFFQLRAIERKTFREIEAQIGVSAKTLVSWAKDMHLQIMATWDLEKESLAQKYGFTDFEKQRLLAEIHQRYATELRNRDLSTLSTEKLLSGLIQLQEQLHDPKKIRTGDKPLVTNLEDFHELNLS